MLLSVIFDVFSFLLQLYFDAGAECNELNKACLSRVEILNRPWPCHAFPFTLVHVTFSIKLPMSFHVDKYLLYIAATCHAKSLPQNDTEKSLITLSV